MLIILDSIAINAIFALNETQSPKFFDVKYPLFWNKKYKSRGFFNAMILYAPFMFVFILKKKILTRIICSYVWIRSVIDLNDKHYQAATKTDMMPSKRKSYFDYRILIFIFFLTHIVINK